MILDTNERFTICRPDNLQGWLKERTNGIGASELASILGLNKYCTPSQYFTKKQNEIECAAAGVEIEEAQSDECLWGHLHEPLISEQFAAATGCKIDPESAGDWLAVYNANPILRVSPDRLFIDKETGEICNLEIKTVENELITKAEDLHLSWFIQVQYQMYVLGLTTTYIAVLCKGCHLRYFKIPYNAEIANDAISKGLEFWEKYIKTNTTPEDVVPQYEGDNAAVANEKCISLIKQVKDTDEQIKALKEDSDKLKEEIRAYFGDAEKLTYFGDTVATYKNSTRRTFDKNMLFVAHPELVAEQEQFTKESETRTLLIKLK